MQVLPQFTGFDWDDGNRQKNWTRHQVAWGECEETLFNQPLYVLPDSMHSSREQRFYALGVTNAGRLLFVVFTQRKHKIRIISARNMSKRERNMYYEKAQEDPQA